MKESLMGTRLVLAVLAALLALPFAPTASPVEAKQRPRTVTRTVRNSAAIAIPTSTTNPLEAVSASPYPSLIEVRGLKGRIRDVNVRLNGFAHPLPLEVGVLLVGPDGRAVIVMAYVGAETAVSNVTLRLDDEAPATLSYDASLRSGVFRPTNGLGGAVIFNDPAPSATTNTDLSVFDGTNPNGTWRLYVQDVFAPQNAGSIAGGWELEITTKSKAKKKRR